MKIARSFAKWILKAPKTDVLESSEYERLLKVERELHSAELELADLSDFVHRMAKRRYTEAYDQGMEPGRRNTKSAPGGTQLELPAGGVSKMTATEKRELLKRIRSGPG
jgi:hypothetical protein